MSNNQRILSAKNILNELVNKFNIQSFIGNIQINLGGITANYSNRDAIGELLQSWLEAWFIENNIYFKTRDNTQEFPDFLLSESNTENFLELKTFNSEAGAAFDIANFDSYCTSLLDNAYRLDSHYLILSYEMQNAKLRIVNVWLKRVWEISSPSKPNPIKIQDKRNVIYNLRPCAWYSEKTRFKPFSNVNEFLLALSKTQQKYDQCAPYRDNWLNRVKSNYFENTGISLM